VIKRWSGAIKSLLIKLTALNNDEEKKAAINKGMNK
jgi:hypothetical protein